MTDRVLGGFEALAEAIAHAGYTIVYDGGGEGTRVLCASLKSLGIYTQNVSVREAPLAALGARAAGARALLVVAGPGGREALTEAISRARLSDTGLAALMIAHGEDHGESTPCDDLQYEMHLACKYDVTWSPSSLARLPATFAMLEAQASRWCVVVSLQDLLGIDRVLGRWTTEPSDPVIAIGHGSIAKISSGQSMHESVPEERSRFSRLLSIERWHPFPSAELVASLVGCDQAWVCPLDSSCADVERDGLVMAVRAAVQREQRSLTIRVISQLEMTRARRESTRRVMISGAARLRVSSARELMAALQTHGVLSEARHTEPTHTILTLASPGEDLWFRASGLPVAVPQDGLLSAELQVIDVSDCGDVIDASRLAYIMLHALIAR
ncbi:MAG: hypothetical protein Q8Q09_25350 [Deltaproteobacteria bacterium]|nr:hypothetical protein [Deltaproteobacteria bacterium]